MVLENVDVGLSVFLLVVAGFSTCDSFVVITLSLVAMEDVDVGLSGFLLVVAGFSTCVSFVVCISLA